MHIYNYAKNDTLVQRCGAQSEAQSYIYDKLTVLRFINHRYIEMNLYMYTKGFTTLAHVSHIEFVYRV